MVKPHIQFVLPPPVHQVQRDDVAQQIFKACEVYHVEGEAVVRDAIHHPGACPGAEKYLPEEMQKCNRSGLLVFVLCLYLSACEVQATWG